VGNWNPGLFGLVVANSIFTATAAFLPVMVGFRILGDRAKVLLAATLFLLNFAVANLYYLVGFVDSGEGCFLIAMV
jgi:hypothetical protein